MAATITFGEISCPRAAEEEEGEANPTGDALSPYGERVTDLAEWVRETALEDQKEDQARDDAIDRKRVQRSASQVADQPCDGNVG